MSTRHRVIAGVLAALLPGGCGGPGEPSREAAVAPFPGSATSMDALGKGVLRALAAGDRTALERVRLTEREHNQVVWPELPASSPDVGFPVDLAWSNIERRNARALAGLSGWYRSRRLEHVRVECRGGMRQFETFRVHTGCREIFRAAGRGLLEVALFEDVLERGGGFKIFRFHADGGPRPVGRRSGP